MNIKAKILSAMTAGSALFMGLVAHAAVDADVSTAASTTIATFKENVAGVITANIANIVIVGVILLSVTLVWRLARRFVGGSR